MKSAYATTVLIGCLLYMLPVASAATPVVNDPGFEILQPWDSGTASSVAVLKEQGTITSILTQYSLQDSSKGWDAGQWENYGLYEGYYLKVATQGGPRWYLITGNNSTDLTIQEDSLLTDGCKPGDAYEIWQFVGRLCDSSKSWVSAPESGAVHITSGPGAGNYFGLAEPAAHSLPSCLTVLGNLVQKGVSSGSGYSISSAMADWNSYTGPGYTTLKWANSLPGGITPYSGIGMAGDYSAGISVKACRYTTITGLTPMLIYYAVCKATTNSVLPGLGDRKNAEAQIGIDTGGGVDPESPSVYWGKLKTPPGNVWRTLFVRFIPTQTSATLFLRAVLGNSALNTVAFDDVEITRTPPLFIESESKAFTRADGDTKMDIKWETNGGTQASMVFYRKAGSSDPWITTWVTEAGDPVTHQVTLTGLQPKTSYEYIVKSNSNADNHAVIDSCQVSSISGGGKTFTDSSKNWQFADQHARLYVKFTTGAAASKGFLPIIASTSNSVTVDYSGTLDAAPGDLFEIRGATVTSGLNQFTTPIHFSDFSLALDFSSASNIVLKFKTDAPVRCSVEYGLTTAYGLETAVEASAAENHSITLTNLANGQLYHVRVKVDPANNPGFSLAFSLDQTFHSLPPPSNEPSTVIKNGGFELTASDQGVTLTDLDKAFYPDVVTYGNNSTESRHYPWVKFSVDVRSFPPDCQKETCQDAIQRCWCNGMDLGNIVGVVGPYPANGPEYWPGGEEIRAPEGSYFLADATEYWWHNGGVFQRIAATPGEPIMVAAKSFVLQSPPPEYYHIDSNNFIGIDPYGGIDPMSPNVIWQPYYLPQGEWADIGLTTTAKSSNVTVFLYIQQRWALNLHSHGIDNVRIEPPANVPIGQLKSMPYGTGVDFSGKVITAKLDNYNIYVQEEDRSAGIRVISLEPVTASRGSRVRIIGTLDGINGEAVINRATVSNAVPGNEPEPIFINNILLGGRAVGTIQKGMTDNGFGVNNVGLLVKVWGVVLPNPNPALRWNPVEAEFPASNDPNAPNNYDQFGRPHMFISDGLFGEWTGGTGVNDPIVWTGTGVTSAYYLVYNNTTRKWENWGNFRGIKVYYPDGYDTYHAYAGDQLFVTGVAGIELSDSNFTDSGGTQIFIRTLHVRDATYLGPEGLFYNYTDILAKY